MCSTALQYNGFTQTPFLWTGTLENLEQFEFYPNRQCAFTQKLPKGLMLGKRAEEFVFFDIENNESLTTIRKNIQINNEKITIGELDGLIQQSNSLLHLEIVYKFYLFIPNKNANEIDCLIGPNQKDSLREKLNKLREKQLPLLKNPITQTHLLKTGIRLTNCQQKVYFKAQVYLPITHLHYRFTTLNPNCIYGFYTQLNGLSLYHTAQFYIPKKTDWMVDPHTHVRWLGYSDFVLKAQLHLDQKRAPLCWLKEPNGNIKKFFLIWWSY